eukprot:GHRR01008412.1.p1 GENE.GHRR01008412.1~~GHRR01008412.1.p1  ORF type:complete len:961 (+),score=374.37 GHRR01008412.1:225-3107(+)
MSDPGGSQAPVLMAGHPGTVTLKSPFQRKTDVFDSEEFDPVKFVNQIYPDESSLGDLDKFIDMLRKQVKAVDKEIFQAVRSQSGTQAKSRQDLTVATSQIGDLFSRIRAIQGKAADSEALVQDICRDICKLDYAKRHLTHTITSLRRLAMLTAAVDDLEQVGRRRDEYKRCANLLEAVTQLLEYFSNYQDVPKIQSLTKRLDVVQAQLQDAVMDDFKLLLGTSDVKLSPDSLERLASACLVVNALGPKVRDQLMDWLCEREMTVYQTIFSMSGDAAKLDRFERRFAWFKGRLEERKEVWGVFPPAWRVPQTLCLTFCKITKAAVKRLLSDSEDVVREDVGPLIKTVVATKKFEKEMAALFGGGSKDEDDDDLQDVDNLPASEARKRLEAFRKKQQAAAAAKQQQQQQTAADGTAHAGGSETVGPDAAAAAAAHVAFEGAISEAFEDALKYYVAEEQKELLRHLDQLIKEEAERLWKPPEGEDTRVLGTANQLFLKIRASLNRCVKLLSRGPTLLRLAGAFKRVLSSYAAELLKRMPKTAAGGTSAQTPFNGTDWYVRLPDEEEGVLTCILATAEYCRETTEALGRSIARELQPGLANSLDLGDEESAFASVASQCLSVLVLGINTRLDACLQDMLRMRWDSIESPGDDSPYVGAMRRILLVEAAPRLGAALDRNQFGFFCDKLGRMFVPRFIETIYKLRKVSEKGTLQLSIDADSVRRLLLEFPRAARPLDDEVDSAPYAHYIEREMGGAVNLVKVMQAKPENLVDTFILLMPANAKTPTELARICELKGFTKKLQSELIGQYTRKVGGTPAADQSPLALAGSGTSGSSSPVPSIIGQANASPVPGGSSSTTATPLGGLGGVSGGAASNLNALKTSVNSFTRELASSMHIRGASLGDVGGSPLPNQREKPTLFKSGGLNFNMQQTAARTREGLAKMANILPGKLGGGGDRGGGSGSGGES